MKISSTGSWITKKPRHFFDRGFCHSALELFKSKYIKSVVDFGCGDASYAKYFSNAGSYVEAYDGNPYTEILTNGIGKVLDLSKPINLGRKFDCVMSIETGEHLPIEYEQVFMDNLAEHTERMIILSWAVPGQDGEGHVNERKNSYVVEQIENRGFTVNRKETAQMRRHCYIEWLKNTIMIFEK